MYSFLIESLCLTYYNMMRISLPKQPIKKNALQKHSTNANKLSSANKKTISTSKTPSRLYAPLLNYLCRIRCPTETHTKYTNCLKGCGYLCNNCGDHSTQLAYLYIHKRLVKCYHHFIPACRLLVHYCNKNILTIYDHFTGVKTKIILDKEINNYSDTVAYNGRIFVMGDSQLTGEVYEINIKEKALIPKAKMLKGKFNHSLCIACKEIYSIGGWDSTTIRDCEKYSVSQNIWSALPKLKLPRAGCAAFSLNSKEIYAVGGEMYVVKSTVERYIIANALKWDTLSIKNELCAIKNFQAIQIDESTVLAFGGDDNRKYKVYRNESQVLNIVGDVVTSVACSNMIESGAFNLTACVVFDGENVYAVDGDKSIHIYSVVAKKWRIVKEVKEKHYLSH